jgi:hypothetical protein
MLLRNVNVITDVFPSFLRTQDITSPLLTETNMEDNNEVLRDPIGIIRE